MRHRRRRAIFRKRSPGRFRFVLRALSVAVAAAFIALLAYGLTTNAPDASLDEALSRGETLAAPGFRLTELADGRPGSLAAAWERAGADGLVNLDELRGTPLALNFWASWCDPCRAEADRLERQWRAAEEQGVLFVGLNQQDAREEARDFLRRSGTTFPQVRDPGKATARAWGVTGMPETFFISRAGDVVGHVVGVISDRQIEAGSERRSAAAPWE